MNGKGDATRPCDWKRYRANHDEINWHRKRRMTWSEVQQFTDRLFKNSPIRPK